jgi:fatty-acyl-CoA synthase
MTLRGGESMPITRFRRRLKLARAVAHRAKSVVALATFDVNREMSLALTLQRRARRHPKDIALIFGRKRWTYKDLDSHVNKRASVLNKGGIRANTVVAMMMDNSAEFVFDVLALNRLGAVPALVNTNLSGVGLRHAVSITQPTALLIGHRQHDAFFQAFEEDGAVHSMTLFVDNIDGDWLPEGAIDLSARAVAELANPRLPKIKVRGTDTIAYIYTSGTTGLPKASKVLNARAAMSGVGFGGAALGLAPHDTVYCCLPLFHSSGFLVAMSSALWNGATFALAPRFSASRFWSEIRETEATAFVYIGEICRYLLNNPPDPQDGEHRLRQIIGNGMRPEIWGPFVERFKPGVVHEFYGATEGNVNMINLTGRFGSVGKMPPGKKLNNALLVKFDHDTQMPVRGANGRCIPCETGEIGELLGRISPKVVSTRFDGYLDKKETEKKILKDVLKPGDAWFRSGDLLKQDDRGYYYFVDRIGDTFRWKGENVSTNEVADVLGRHDDIDMANVYGVKIGDMDGKAGMATLVLNEGAQFNPTEFYGLVTKELPNYARPAFLRIAGAAALTETFKLKKTDLVKDGFDPGNVSDPLWVRDDAKGKYVKLTKKLHARVVSGKARV